MSSAEHPTPVRRAAAKKPQKKPPAARALGQGVSHLASQRAAVILEALAGERTPRQAAAALSMSVNNFYILERKALGGLLRACEPQPKGPPGPGPERKLEMLQRELTRCQRDCQRQAALVRATQRAVGLPATPAVREVPPEAGPNGKRRRRRRAAARALRAAKVMRKNSLGGAPPSELKPMLPAAAGTAPESLKQETEHVPATG